MKIFSPGGGKRIDLLRVLSSVVSTLQERSGRLGQTLSGLALGALTVEELESYTVAVYDRLGEYTPDQGVRDCEKEWWASALPPPPCRLLVGGAGSGREVRFLSQLGYRCVAFDPARSFVQKGKELVDSGECVAFLVGGYDTLTVGPASASDSVGSFLRDLGPFDAALCGWGSICHLASAEGRVGALRALGTLCPSGPLLLSFPVRGFGPQFSPGRASLLGWRLGAALTLNRGGAQTDPRSDLFTWRGGFTHYFDLDLFRRECARADYEIVRLFPVPGESWVCVTLQQLARSHSNSDRRCDS